jgi:hypothetical protein
VFPKWTNKLPTVLLMGVLGGLVTVIGGVWYYFTPKFWRSGYMPSQPALTSVEVTALEDFAKANGKPPDVPGETFPGFSHQIHAGKLAMDCRYCHSHVEESAEANIPSVSTCMGCHAPGHVNDELYAKAHRVKFIRDAWESNGSIEWRRVHKLPDYVRNFPHQTHVKAGVSCYSCHGNIMEQEIVHEVQPLSMGWCLECHRNPEPHLVPADKVTDLYWVRNQIEKDGVLNGNPATTGQAGNPLDPGSKGGAALLQALKEHEGDVHIIPTNCGACHY